jgi:hypothetical protein
MCNKATKRVYTTHKTRRKYETIVEEIRLQIIQSMYTYIHTYKLYLFTLASTTLYIQADFHEGRDLELFTG